MSFSCCGGTGAVCARGPQPSNTPTVRIGSAAITLSGRVWRIVLTILRLPMELLSLASFKAQQVRPRARPRTHQPPRSTRCSKTYSA